MLSLKNNTHSGNYAALAAIMSFITLLVVAYTCYNIVWLGKSITKESVHLVESQKYSHLSYQDKNSLNQIIKTSDKFFNDKDPLFYKIKEENMSVVNKRSGEGFEEYRLDYNDKQNIRAMFNYFFLYGSNEREIVIWNLNPQQCHYLFDYYTKKGMYVETFEFQYTEGIKNRGKPIDCESFTQQNSKAALFIEV